MGSVIERYNKTRDNNQPPTIAQDLEVRTLLTSSPLHYSKGYISSVSIYKAGKSFLRILMSKDQLNQKLKLMVELVLYHGIRVDDLGPL